MGVVGLESFMERSAVTYKVDLRRLVERYKQKNGTEDVVLVVDGMSIMHYLYIWNGVHGGLSWLNGGQLLEFGDRVRDFVQSLQAIGITPVFFFDGPLDPSKRVTYKLRRLRTLDDIYKVHDSIQSTPTHHNLSLLSTLDSNLSPRQFSILPLGSFNTITYVIQHVCRVQLIMARKECDLEIAEYAKSHGCFGILAQDSDFVIYDFGGYYLSMKNFDLDRLTTIVYDRELLARSLSLQPAHLPLFASLLGNDFIQLSDLKDFHRRVMQKYRRGYDRGRGHNGGLTDAVAGVVRTVPTGPDMNLSLPHLASYVFGNHHKASILADSMATYQCSPLNTPEVDQKSLEGASSNSGWNAILKRASEIYLKGQLSPSVYQVLRDRLYTCGTNLEDFRIPDLTPSPEILFSLRRRIYGVMFYEKVQDQGVREGSDDLNIEELVVTGRHSFDTVNRVTPLYPPKEIHPGLLAIWDYTGNDSEAIINAKWGLIGYIVSLDQSQLTRLRHEVPLHLIILVLSLICIIRETKRKMMKEWEVDAVIAMGVCHRGQTIETLRALPPGPLTCRAITLYTIFGRTVESLCNCFLLCGCPIATDQIEMLKYMDGKLFHEKYRCAQKIAATNTNSSTSADQLCNQSVSELEVFNRIKKFIYDCLSV